MKIQTDYSIASKMHYLIKKVKEWERGELKCPPENLPAVVDDLAAWIEPAILRYAPNWKEIDEQRFNNFVGNRLILFLQNLGANHDYIAIWGTKKTRHPIKMVVLPGGDPPPGPGRYYEWDWNWKDYDKILKENGKATL